MSSSRLFYVNICLLQLVKPASGDLAVFISALILVQSVLYVTLPPEYVYVRRD